MINWMQKHRRYLVVTIWISTIAFVGAGFVGWGSYEYGSNAKNVAKVGEKEINFETYQLVYQNLYNQYNSMLGGKMDEKMAKEMGLEQVALDNLINQAYFINLADEYGIIVSDKEVVQKIASMQAFQKDGVFDPQIYKQAIAQMRIKPAQFESILKDEIKITKLLNLFDIPAFDIEKEALQAVVADKIEYKVLNLSDIKVTVDEAEAKEYYQTYKDDFKTPRKYKLSILWTQSKDINYTEEDIDSYYEDARFNHRDDEGKILPLKEVYDTMVQEFQMQRAKKQAQRDYIAFKDGEMQPHETITLDEYEMFYPQTWKDIIKVNENEFIKPNPLESRYASIKVEEIIQPQAKPFDAVKEEVFIQAEYEKSLQTLKEVAQDSIATFTGEQTRFFTLTDMPELKGLNEYESFEFGKFLFEQSAKEGVFQRGESAIVYKIIDQKLIQSATDIKGLKEAVLEENLLKSLQKAQETKVYIK